MTQENPAKKNNNMKVIALSVVCFILAASLVGVVAFYHPGVNSDLQTQITQKDATISSLQTQNGLLQSQLSQTNGTAAAYVNQIAFLQQELASANSLVSGYFNIAILNASSILVYQQPLTQDANASTSIFSDAIDYAGYVVVQATATSNTTYAEVLYSYGGNNFDYTQKIGTSGSVVFPVLPGGLQINIGNTNQTVANDVTATAIYYY